MNAHEVLLQSWSQEKHHQGQCFIKDGIIDMDRWRSGDKVLFLLKDARSDSDSWDLRKYLREEILSALRWPTWLNAAYWSYAIYHIKRGKLPGLPLPAQRAEYDKAVQLLLSSAVVNIKKSGGRSRAVVKDIDACAQRDRQFIQRQIELIKPDVVICGNTWQFVEKWWPKSRVYDGVYRVGHRVFVDFWHPSYEISNELKYFALAGQVQNSNVLASPLAAVA